jgi:two-component system, sensor histidine kinase and response regulator
MTTWVRDHAEECESTTERAAKLYGEQLRAVYERVGQFFAVLLVLEWSAAVCFAMLVTPYTWAGESRWVHLHVWAAIVLGGAVVSLPVALSSLRPAAAMTRHAVAIGQMLMGVLLIHLSGGRIEFHFHVFVSLAFLSLYRDWKVLITASAVVAVDHFLRGIFWPRSVYGVLTASPWRWLEHSAWVIFEAVVLVRACRQLCGKMRELATQHAEIEASHARVEQRVRERTADLSLANHELTRQALELRESEMLMALIIESAPDAIVTMDHRGVISEFNPAAEKIFGYSKEAALGRRLEDLIIPPKQRRAPGETGAGLFLGFVMNPDLHPAEFSCIHADGSEFPAELTVRKVDRVGVPPLVIGFVNDVTVQKLAESTLREAAATALAASRAKSEFLANMSHEIRTPMNGIIGMTDLALDTDLSMRQREYLGLVKSSADALLTVINDILDFSKIEAGKLSLADAPFGLRHLLDETLQALALRAHSKDLELACRIAPDVPDRLNGDSGRLRQVIVNLVGNAIKFTERGEVVVSVCVWVEESSDETVTLRVAIADTGIGIPREKLQTIFQPFEQADGSTTRRFGGTGLGLTISYKLVELMGGSIWVESEPGKGSTFGFTVKMGVQALEPSSTPEPDLSRLHGLQVLIVDDNATNRLILTEVLSSWGVRPTAVDGARAALASLRSAAARGEPFPVALIDGMMPEMDGFDLAEQIRREPEVAAVRLLLLTSAGQPDDTARCRALAISVCLTKPVRQSELFDALVKEMTVWTRAVEIRQPPRPALEFPVSAGSGVPLRVLLAEDHPVNQKVAVRMLEHLGHGVVVVPHGGKALAALEAGRFDVVLMDLQMPEMDGFEALREIRRRDLQSDNHTTVIALTAHAMQGDRERCLAAGFDGYLAKPIRQADLHTALERLEARETPHAPEPDRSLIERLTEVCGGDEDFARELALTFLESAPGCLSGIDLALERGDSPELSAQAHALKGISRTIGAGRMALACVDLEQASHRNDLARAAREAAHLSSIWKAVKNTLENYLVVEIKA